jgi:hypothetical protein
MWSSRCLQLVRYRQDYTLLCRLCLLRHADMACWNLFVLSAAADAGAGLSAAAASRDSRAVYSDTSAIVVFMAEVAAPTTNA